MIFYLTETFNKMFLFLFLTIGVSCKLPQIVYYGDRMKGFDYSCLYHLGSRPGITPPCAQMCPYNITFPFEGKILHLTTATVTQHDKLTYQMSLVGSNCVSGTVAVRWYGSALTLFLGSDNSASHLSGPSIDGSTNQNLYKTCPSTSDPFPCSC